jgi:hypothetical protein
MNYTNVKTAILNFSEYLKLFHYHKSLQECLKLNIGLKIFESSDQQENWLNTEKCDKFLELQPKFS